MARAQTGGVVISFRAAFWKPALGGPIMTPWHMPPGDGSHRGRVLLGHGRTRHLADGSCSVTGQRRGGMTQEYLIGELSVRLERLQARLRDEVETGTPGGLVSATARALTLADDLCWQSLSDGDTGAFARQALACADLRLFGICAHLLTDD
jgi:hypothetical protein